MAHESSRKCLCLSAFFIGKHHNLIATMDVFKDGFAVLKTEQTCYLRLVKEHLTKLFGSKISVDTTGNDDATLTAVASEVVTLLGEELVKIYVSSLLLTIDDRYLVFIF